MSAMTPERASVILDDATFQSLLCSAKLGSWLNLTGSLYRLSGEQLGQLLVASKETQKGKVITRGEDYDPIWLAHLMLNYGPNLDIVWSTSTQL
ncbi:hypothetical protein ACAX43_26645 [Paraburkholderia sp. IW21]|uniref:hypothetical protein n=1 Tax=Paraburkholderia sp. IW21 TaxID=3242488 RepID=UPI003520C3B3